MLRSSRNNRNGKNNKTSNNRPLVVEKLEGRDLMAQFAFGNPVNLRVGVNSVSIDGGPTETGDGLRLVFASSRSSTGAGRSIFEATRDSTEAPFGNVVSVGSNVNSLSEHTSHPDVSNDGLTLIFQAGFAGS